LLKCFRPCCCPASQAVGTRIPQEVMLHAHQYFLRLQSLTEGQDDPAMTADDANWTFEEETVFENGMATFDEDDTERWTKIASLLPEKSPDDVRTRYQKLMYDITRIEAGMTVTVEYKVKQRFGGSGGTALPLPPRAKTNGGAPAATGVATAIDAATGGGDSAVGGGAQAGDVLMTGMVDASHADMATGDMGASMAQ
jgi:Myb-like DNA-binding domain